MLFLKIPKEICGRSPFNLYRYRTPEEMFSLSRVKLYIKEIVPAAASFHAKAS